MALYEQTTDSVTGTPKTQSTPLKITWPASWGITLLAVFLIVTGIAILLPANAVLIGLNAIVAIAAGILLLIGK